MMNTAKPAASPARRKAVQLSLLCAAVYFCSYLTRHNFAAVMVVITRDGFSEQLLAAALTGMSITYGVGQLISGYLGDKLPAYLLIFGGLLVCAAMNLLIPLCPSAGWMVAVWSMNGLAQAMMWPPLVKVMSMHLHEQDYKRAVVWVSWGGSVGTIAVYLLAPVLISLGGWRPVFIVAAGVAAAMAILWRLCYQRLAMPVIAPAPKKQADAQDKGGALRTLAPVMGLIMLAIVLHGSLRDGITSWTPTYLSNIYPVDASLSILSSVVLPLFAIGCHEVTLILNRRLIKNEMALAAVIFLAGLAALGALTLIGSASFPLTVLALAVSVGSMHGVNLILTCLIPPYLARYGRTSFVSGLLNSCTYVGAALSTSGIAVLKEQFGWHTTLLVWCLIALAGTLCCAAVVRKWQCIREQD